PFERARLEVHRLEVGAHTVGEARAFALDPRVCIGVELENAAAPTPHEFAYRCRWRPPRTGDEIADADRGELRAVSVQRLRLRPREPAHRARAPVLPVRLDFKRGRLGVC